MTKMRRAMNNRSLIGRFKEILSWVAIKSGKTFLEYDKKNTTRTCHRCDHIITDGISPAIREWQCSKCLTHHNRDENAADLIHVAFTCWLAFILVVVGWPMQKSKNIPV